MKGRGDRNSSLPAIRLALGSGILLFLSFPGAAGLWPVAWLALVPLLLAVRATQPARAFRLGLLTGMVHYVSLMYWIVIVLGRYGNLPLWIAIPGLLLLSLYMSVYYGVFCAVMSRVWQERESLIVWIGPLLWVGLDYIRSFLFTGLPWQDLAYSQYKALLLVQTADLTGHYGITFHIVLVNCVSGLLLVLWLANRSSDQSRQQELTLRLRAAWFYAVLPALAMIVIVLGYNFVRYRQVSAMVAETPAMGIGVVQGSIDQNQKWSPAMRLATIDIYSELSRQALAQEDNKAELLVWPETALPFLVTDNPYFNRLKKSLPARRDSCLLSGAPYYKEVVDSPRQRKVLSYNSAYLFSPEWEIRGRYDKQHLVPFGEYVPLHDYLPLPGPLVENIGNFSSGEPKEPLSCRQARIGVLICFESIFPELARDWTDRGANLLVNITNDAWFGRSSAPWQHLSMSVFRAIENRRSLARAANTGVSAIIDPLGRISGYTPLFQPFYLVADVPLLETRTIFVDFGHYFGLFCLLASVPLLYLLRKSRRHET